MSENNDFKAQHPMIAEMTIDQIMEAAERWMALGQMPFVYEENARGFEDAHPEAEHPAYRRLNLMLETKVINDRPEQPLMQRVNAMSRLTEMADLVRATQIEERLTNPDR